MSAHEKQVRTRRRSAPEVGDSQNTTTQTNADVAQMASAIAEGRATERQTAIAMAAYFRAEKRGFEPGHELDDWLAAEAEVADVQVLSSSVQSTESGSVS